MKPASSGSATVAPGKLRQEIFMLGGRHRGEALAGALDELKDPLLSADRRTLLQAVVRHLTPATPKAATATAARSGPARLRLAHMPYVVVIAAALACAAIIALGLLVGR